jgi:hypothetical protein
MWCRNLTDPNREANVNEVQQVSQAFETSKIMQVTQQMAQKDEVKVEEYREAVSNAVKENLTPEANTKILQDSKFSTLDGKTKDWVIKEFTRSRGLSTSNSFSAMNSKEFWEQFGTTPEQLQQGPSPELDSNTIHFARKAFAKYDTDSDGTITLNELAEAMKDHGIAEEQAIEIMNRLDVDGNGKISFKEFLQGYTCTIRDM